MKAEITAIASAVVSWLVIIFAGPVIWETSMDKIQGIVLGLIITGVAVWYCCKNSHGRQEEYDEWGDRIV